MKLTIRPLTPELWPALADLFGENAPPLSHEGVILAQRCATPLLKDITLPLPLSARPRNL